MSRNRRARAVPQRLADRGQQRARRVPAPEELCAGVRLPTQRRAALVSVP